VIRRLSAGSPASHGVPAAVVPVVTARDAGFVGMFDVVLPMVLLGAGTGNVYMNTGDLFQPSGFPGVDAQTIARVPRSRAYKTKLRAWEALNTKILAECFGVIAGNLREQPDGLELAGGQFFGKGGLTRALDLTVEQFTVTHGSERTWELYGQRSTLEEELRRIRTADVATALRLPMPLE
jgi:hypothetical protein